MIFCKSVIQPPTPTEQKLFMRLECLEKKLHPFPTPQNRSPLNLHSDPDPSCFLVKTCFKIIFQNISSLMATHVGSVSINILKSVPDVTFPRFPKQEFPTIFVRGSYNSEAEAQCIRIGVWKITDNEITMRGWMRLFGWSVGEQSQ